MNMGVGAQYVSKCLGESEMDIVMRAKVTGDCNMGMSESRKRNGFLCTTRTRRFICIVDSRGRDVVVDRCKEQEDKEKNNREPYNLSPPCTGRTTNSRPLPAKCAICRRILLRLCTGCSLCILFCEDTNDPCSDFVVHDSLVVLAHDVDTEFLKASSAFIRLKGGVVTYHDIVRLELEWFRLDTFRAQPLAINERPVRALDIFNEDLSRFQRLNK